MWGLCYCAGFSLVAASGATFQLWCLRSSSRWLLLLQSTGSRAAGAAARGLSSFGSQALEHGLSSCCSKACGIVPDQGLNPRLLHWQADSLPLSHQRSLSIFYLYFIIFISYCWVLLYIFSYILDISPSSDMGVAKLSYRSTICLSFS